MARTQNTIDPIVYTSLLGAIDASPKAPHGADRYRTMAAAITPIGTTYLRSMDILLPFLPCSLRSGSAPVAIPEPPGRAAITFEWYRDFLNLLINNDAQVWFGWLIVFGELAVGMGLIFGVLTGFAAFFGALMNMSFLLAGSASTNPVLFALGIGLILAWRVAGYYGVDRWLLPRLGVPWHARVVEQPAMRAPMTS